MTARNVFRTLDRLTDVMARATMPRTSAADPVPAAAPHAARVWRLPVMAPLTFTLADAARAR